MDEKIKNIGKLSNKLILFGGVYSNLQALEALYEIAKKENIPPQNCICTGDIIGYCAQPEESLQFIKNWNIHSIAGNVELQIKNNEDTCGCDFEKGSRCDVFSQSWYPYAKSKLSESSINYIENLPEFITFQFANKQFTVVHGSYFNTSEFIFKSTSWKIKSPNFLATNSNVIIAGHCGLPFVDVKDDYLWINPGVIGMPANDGNTTVWYLIVEQKNDTFSFVFKNFQYNYLLASNLMLDYKLPKEYAKTITNGIWDNTDILPEIEKKQQGEKINFY